MGNITWGRAVRAASERARALRQNSLAISRRR